MFASKLDRRLSDLKQSHNRSFTITHEGFGAWDVRYTDRIMGISAWLGTFPTLQAARKLAIARSGRLGGQIIEPDRDTIMLARDATQATL